MNSLDKKHLSRYVLTAVFMLLPVGLFCQDNTEHESTASGPEERQIENTVTGQLDLLKLDNYIIEAMQEWLVPGMAIAIVKDDSVVFSRGYGVKEYGQPGKVDENTIFHIASITKGFTSTALAMLDDEELLDWDDHVRKHLPWFSLYDPYVSDEIRIRDLLCHRSGLMTFSGDLLWYGTDYSRSEIVRRARYLEPGHGFRYEFGYSNLMFLAASEIIPEVSNMSWDDLVRNKILFPLRMDRTSVTTDGIMNLDNVALPHHVDLLEEEVNVIPYWELNNIAPAMGMNSCASDLCNWIRFNLNLGEWEGEQLVSSENLWETQKLHTQQSPDLYSRRIWPSMHFSGYGLGWDLYDYHGCKIIAHEGGSDGMISRLVMVPDESLGFILLTNSMSGITMALENYILDQYFEGESYDWSAIYKESILDYLEVARTDWITYKEAADRSLRPTNRLSKYAGTYGGDMYGQVEVRSEKNGLVLDFLPSTLLTGDLEEFSGDTFLIRLRNVPSLPEGTVKFFLNGKGEVLELKVDIPNPDFNFTELELKWME